MIVFRVKRAFGCHISNEYHAIYRAFCMLILIAFSYHVHQLLQLRPAYSHCHCEPLSTSFVPHPQTWFSRLILKRGSIQWRAFRQSYTCQNKPRTPLLKSPLIYLPHVSLKVSFPTVSPLSSHPSAQVFFQSCEKLLAFPPSVLQVSSLRMITVTARGFIRVDWCCFKTLCNPHSAAFVFTSSWQIKL